MCEKGGCTCPLLYCSAVLYWWVHVPTAVLHCTVLVGALLYCTVLHCTVRVVLVVTLLK